MKLLLKPFHWLYCIYAFTLFVVIMLLLVPFVVIASFFGRMTGGNLIYYIVRLWADTWLFCIGIIHRRVTEEPADKHRQYIFISNHISYLDIPQMLKAVRQNMRILGKEEMTKVPVFGFIYKKAVVTVARDRAEGRAKSVKTLRSILGKGVSIFIAPEGTFNMGQQALKEFYDGAFRLAIETQTPIKPLLFLDTYDRMHYGSVFSLNPGRLRTVYLEAISPEGFGPRDVQLFKDKVFVIMQQKLEAYKASWIKPVAANNAS
jgi:1-acyl-sn-glycerol-3-phosphate acyltransferase